MPVETWEVTLERVLRDTVSSSVQTDEQMNILVALSLGIIGALSAADTIGLDNRTKATVTLSSLIAAFEIGKRSGGLQLHVESEPFGMYVERDSWEIVTDQTYLTPSQVDLKNHINEVAGLDRRWVPA